MPLPRSRYEYEKLRRKMKVSGDELAPQGISLLAELVLAELIRERSPSTPTGKPIECEKKADKLSQSDNMEQVA